MLLSIDHINDQRAIVAQDVTREFEMAYSPLVCQTVNANSPRTDQHMESAMHGLSIPCRASAQSRLPERSLGWSTVACSLPIADMCIQSLNFVFRKEWMCL